MSAKLFWQQDFPYRERRPPVAAMRAIMAKLKFRPLHDRVVVKGGGEDQGRHHHPGYRQGETAGG
jgi:hypothetical protein